MRWTTVAALAFVGLALWGRRGRPGRSPAEAKAAELVGRAAGLLGELAVDAGQGGKAVWDSALDAYGNKIPQVTTSEAAKHVTD